MLKLIASKSPFEGLLMVIILGFFPLAQEALVVVLGSARVHGEDHFRVLGVLLGQDVVLHQDVLVLVLQQTVPVYFLP